MSITPITNAASLSIANNVYLATCLHIVNTGSTVRTLTIANTISHLSGGGNYPGGQAQIFLNGNATLTLNKKPTDTVNGGSAEVKATKIARTVD
jgi:hypothetical protein